MSYDGWIFLKEVSRKVRCDSEPPTISHGQAAIDATLTLQAWAMAGSRSKISLASLDCLRI